MPNRPDREAQILAILTQFETEVIASASTARGGKHCARALTKLLALLPAPPPPAEEEVRVLRDAITAIQDDRDRIRDEPGQAYVTARGWPQRWEDAIALLEHLYLILLRPDTVLSALTYDDVRAGQTLIQVSEVQELRVRGTRVESRIFHEFEGWQDWTTELDLTFLDTPVTLVEP